MRQKIVEILLKLITNRRSVELLINSADQIMEVIKSHGKLYARSEQIELLDKYTRFLQKNGYIDTDATCEEPFAIEEFLKELNQSHEKP